MGRFCQASYAGRGIAVNDIGAVCYLADPQIFDVWGLGTLDVCQARLQAGGGDGVTWPDIERLAELAASRHVEAIIAYDSVLAKYGDPARAGWIHVGSWTIHDNVVCAAARVSFYAPDATQAPVLARALERFAPQLPASVEWTRP
jgi:hypothetical protein